MAGESGSAPTPTKPTPTTAASTGGARPGRKTLLVTYRGEGGHRRCGLYFGSQPTEVVDPTPDVEKALVADNQLIVIDPAKRKKAAPKLENASDQGKTDNDGDDEE